MPSQGFMRLPSSVQSMQTYNYPRIEKDSANRWLRDAMLQQKTPVFLLTGFLGSGKTTLLNKALKDPALANTAVVVNELGEIGLDNVVIGRATDNVVLLDAGCLCCANTGGLQQPLGGLSGRRGRG